MVTQRVQRVWKGAIALLGLTGVLVAIALFDLFWRQSGAGIFFALAAGLSLAMACGLAAEQLWAAGRWRGRVAAGLMFAIALGLVAGVVVVMRGISGR
jgi:hypothetical protein